MKIIIAVGIIALCSAGCSSTRQAQSNEKLLPPLRSYVSEVANELETVPAGRRIVLEKIATTPTRPQDRPITRQGVESIKIVPADSVK